MGAPQLSQAAQLQGGLMTKPGFMGATPPQMGGAPQLAPGQMPLAPGQVGPQGGRPIMPGGPGPGFGFNQPGGQPSFGATPSVGVQHPGQGPGSLWDMILQQQGKPGMGSGGPMGLPGGSAGGFRAYTN